MQEKKTQNTPYYTGLSHPINTKRKKWNKDLAEDKRNFFLIFYLIFKISRIMNLLKMTNFEFDLLNIVF